MNTIDRPVTYRDIPGFPGYRCGDDGSVWSSRRGRWKRLAPRPGRRGRLRVALRHDGKTHDCLISRLILMAFVGPCPDGMECLHFDDDLANNALPNLRWGTRKENIEDAHRNGRYKSSPRFDEAEIAAIRRLRAGGMTFVGLARLYLVSPGTISKAIRGAARKGIGG